MRCFVAVDLSDEARDAIGAAQATLRAAAARADVGWVATEKLHLTLKFLGEIDEAMAATIETTLAETVGDHRAFEIVAGGVGGFPSRTRPRVVWAGLTGGLREIGLLAADVERTCQRLGFPLEARPFRGHVTIGRVRSPRGLSRVLRAMDALADAVFDAWTVREVVLYRSHLGGREGSRYEALARLRLGARSGD